MRPMPTVVLVKRSITMKEPRVLFSVYGVKASGPSNSRLHTPISLRVKVSAAVCSNVFTLVLYFNLSNVPGRVLVPDFMI